MIKKRIVYFVTKSSNAFSVVREAIDRSHSQDIAIFFDLDGSRVLDVDYARKLVDEENNDFLTLINSAFEKKIKFYGCQLNVMTASGHRIIESVESVGVATFLEHAFNADAVFSY